VTERTTLTYSWFEGDRPVCHLFYDLFYVVNEKEGAKLTIRSSSHVDGIFFVEYARRSVTFKQRTLLLYEPTAVGDLDSLHEDFKCIEDFFALLLGSFRPLPWPTFVQCDDDGPARWCSAYFYRGSSTEASPNVWMAWASFPEIRDDLGNLFFAWQSQVREYRGAYLLYAASLRNPLPYPEHRFANLIWSIESFDRQRSSDLVQAPSAIIRRARIQSILQTLHAANQMEDCRWFNERSRGYDKDRKLSDRIFDLLTELPVKLPVEGLRHLCQQCAQRRNQITHEAGPSSNESFEDFSSAVWDLFSALSCLFHACLLLQIGMDRRLVSHALTSSALAKMRITPALYEVGLAIDPPAGDVNEA
jgi:hypothetical protein